MVGVAGKSKACHSCKRRRITCGLQRPQCSQCMKSNLVCPGYQRDRVFINTEPTSWPQKRAAKSTCGKDRDDARKPDKLLKNEPLAIVSICEKSIAALDKDPSQEIAPYAAYRQQLLSAFLYQLVPKMQTEFSGERSWLALVPEISKPTKALEVSMTALCMVSLGRRNEDPVLVHQSLRLYAQALREMQKALWDPQLMFSDETLGACMALAMYELLGCPDASRHAYSSHQSGLAKLVELRGPEAHATGFARQLFLTFRTQNILNALDKHRSTFLSTELWLSKPWATTPKSPIDQIFDLCSFAPGIFEEADKLDGLPTHDSLHEMLKMVNRCWKIDADLAEIFSKLEASTLGPLYWPELAKGIGSLEDEELGKVFPVAFHFLNLKMSYTMMMYWGTGLILWSGLCQLYQAIYKLDLDCEDIDCFCSRCDKSKPDADNEADAHLHKFDISSLPPLEHRANFPSLARDICQSVEYCMHESMGQVGAFSAAAPLAIALDNLRHLPGCSREAAWAQAAMARIVARGLRILKY